MNVQTHLDSPHQPNRRSWILSAGSVAILPSMLFPRNTSAQTTTPQPASDRRSTSSRSRRDENKEPTPRIGFDLPKTQRWRMGLRLKVGSTCQNVIATFAIPVAWPEQSVRMVNKEIDSAVARWIARPAPGNNGTTQVVLSMPKVTSGSSANAVFEFDVTKSRITPPEQTDDLQIFKKVPREIRQYLGPSPQIDSNHRLIREASLELSKEPYENAWELVERIYDFVRENVRYVNGPIMLASEALRKGEGDCEEMTSLFVALCRRAKIPARMVWVPEHCYPEFCLEDPEGNPHWFPCQAAGTRQFGAMEEYRPILQKGDRFRIPEKRGETVRYLTEFFTCQVKGKSNPSPRFLLEQIEI